MKERTCRIAPGRISTAWALAVSVVIVCTLAGAAWAQSTTRTKKDPTAVVSTDSGQRQKNPDRQPNPRLKDADAKQDPRQAELMLQGQRLALEAILEAMRNVAASTEAALREQGDTKNDTTQILRFELAEMQNHIRRLESRLASLDPSKASPQKDGDATGVRKRVRDSDEPIKQVRTPRDKAAAGDALSAEQIQNQIARAQARLKQLEEQGQGDSADAQKIRERLRKLREQLANLSTTDQPRQR